MWRRFFLDDEMALFRSRAVLHGKVMMPNCYLVICGPGPSATRIDYSGTDHRSRFQRCVAAHLYAGHLVSLTGKPTAVRDSSTDDAEFALDAMSILRISYATGTVYDFDTGRWLPGLSTEEMYRETRNSL